MKHINLYEDFKYFHDAKEIEEIFLDFISEYEIEDIHSYPYGHQNDEIKGIFYQQNELRKDGSYFGSQGSIPHQDDMCMFIHLTFYGNEFKNKFESMDIDGLMQRIRNIGFKVTSRKIVTPTESGLYGETLIRIDV